MTFDNCSDLLDFADNIFMNHGLPKPFRMLVGRQRVLAGEEVRNVAKDIGTTSAKLTQVLDARDPLVAAFGVGLNDVEEKEIERAKLTLGQLLIGTIAERVFEHLYKEEMGTNELRLEDDRHSRTDTDYRVLNGQSRPVFRINIKFHGARFRNAMDLVGLDPDDCFPLATYKIHQGLKKQEEEVLAYLFAIVGVRDLTREIVGSAIPDRVIEFLGFVYSSKMPKKRDVEDTLVEYLLDRSGDQQFLPKLKKFRTQIESADWHVLSARRADKLLREMLFERVYAVRVRNFARSYRNAELDMHFSVSSDLTTLEEFFRILREGGTHSLSTHMERGLL